VDNFVEKIRALPGKGSQTERFDRLPKKWAII